MSEYMEKFLRITAGSAPPGYVGYEEGRYSHRKKVRRKPYSVVLLDEIEEGTPGCIQPCCFRYWMTACSPTAGKES